MRDRTQLYKADVMAALIYILILMAGLAVLYIGAESVVSGAVNLARLGGVSPSVAGLTLVAFGTSAPELSLDVTAALRGNVALAVGDLVGSNIANIGLVLGLSATICPLAVTLRLVRVEMPIVIAISLGMWALAGDGTIGRIDGAILLVAFVGFLILMYRAPRQQQAQLQNELEKMPRDNSRGWVSGLFVLGGLLGLVLGGQLIVHAAVAIAHLFEVSELVIGLTIVALGTSLPELATSIVGTLRGQTELVIGNVLGSNVFNLLLVMGVVAQIQPLPIAAQSLRFDVPVMIGFAVALIPIMLADLRVRRWEGVALLAAYTAFITWQGFGEALAVAGR